jgi:hypothetical protein
MRFKKIELPDGNVIIDTGLPQRNIKPKNFENGTVRNLSKGLVSMIFDMSKRDAVRAGIYVEIEETMGADGGASLDHAERSRTESEIWFERALEGVAEHIDSAFGITHRLAIGTFGTASDEGELPGGDEVEGSLDTDAGMEGEWKDVDPVK